VNSMELIKASGAESDLQARYEECVHVSANAEGKSRAYSQLAMNVTAFIQQMVSTAIVVVAYYHVTDEKITMGAMVGCVLMAGRAMGPLALVASLLTRLQQSRRSLKGLNEIMKNPLERDERGSCYVGISSVQGRISVRDITFAHDPQGEVVLKGVSFQIEPGERVALLGRIGSGKSTMLRILTSLYSAGSGSITVGGIELRQIDPAEWRRRVGYVPQDPALLYGTLRSWLTAGCHGVSDEAIWRAVERAGLASFVRGLPRGLDHPIAEGGRNLSGGQRQALCLARALVTEPSILILDEPTSSIDQSTELLVLKELDAYLKADPSRTLIVATHRRSILQLVTRIVALDGGKVVADGPRDVVLKGQAPAVVDRAVRLSKTAKPEAALALAPVDCPDLPSTESQR
jgi:ATP-binding cassette subfamily C protein LapB